MSKRTEELASRLEQGVAQLVTYAESLNAQEWAMSIAQEGRSVGVLVHHVATMFPVEMQFGTRSLPRGRQWPGSPGTWWPR